MVFQVSRLVFYCFRSVFMVFQGSRFAFSWFQVGFHVFSRFQFCFSWFQVGFEGNSCFQVGFYRYRSVDVENTPKGTHFICILAPRSCQALPAVGWLWSSDNDDGDDDNDGDDDGDDGDVDDDDDDNYDDDWWQWAIAQAYTMASQDTQRSQRQRAIWPPDTCSNYTRAYVINIIIVFVSALI